MRPFASAVQQVVTWVTEHRTTIAGDVAMVFGTGFPPFRGGLLRYADAIGPAVMVDRLARLADAHGERFRPAQLLRDMVRAESRFYPA